MRSLRTWRTGFMLVLLAGLLAASELKGAPRLMIQNPTALYLLAQYKLAVGEKGSGLELLDRALACSDSACRDSASSRATTVAVSGICPRVTNP